MEIKDKNNLKMESSFLFFWKNKMKELFLFKNRSRKNLENSLRESENLYRTLIEIHSNAFHYHKMARLFWLMKPFAKCLGIQWMKLLSLGRQDLIAPEDRQRVVDIHTRRMRDEFGHSELFSKFPAQIRSKINTWK